MFGLLFYDYINVFLFLFYAEKFPSLKRALHLHSSFQFQYTKSQKQAKSLGSFFRNRYHLNEIVKCIWIEFSSMRSHIFVSVPNPTYQSDIYILCDNHISLLNYRCPLSSLLCSLLMSLCLFSSSHPLTVCTTMIQQFGFRHKIWIVRWLFVRKQQHHDLLLRCVRSGQHTAHSFACVFFVLSFSGHCGTFFSFLANSIPMDRPCSFLTSRSFFHLKIKNMMLLLRACFVSCIIFICVTVFKSNISDSHLNICHSVCSISHFIECARPLEHRGECTRSFVSVCFFLPMHLLHFVSFSSLNQQILDSRWIQFLVITPQHKRMHTTECENRDSILGIFTLHREPHFKSLAHTRISTLIFNLIFVLNCGGALWRWYTIFRHCTRTSWGPRVMCVIIFLLLA